MQTSMHEIDTKSYRQILKSTSIMGGSSVITIFLRIIRTKALAVLLGPTGVGLLGMYDSITGLVINIAGMGIGTSGVRQIAEANGTNDNTKISRTIICLRRASLISGIAGFLLLFILSEPISRITFGNSGHAHELALLSITILFAGVTGGQTALIQGLSRIRDLAMLSILGAFSGTLLSIPIVYLLGERGIVLFLIAVSAMTLLTSWLYSKRIKVINVRISWSEAISEAKPLFKLGLVFMSTTLMSLGIMYLVRVLIVHQLGLGAAGMYQAAIALSSIYVGIILEAMGRDFFPRLTAITQDNPACISLVNKQMELGLLMAIPGILATMTFAPVVISIFYSAKFMAANDVLRWQLLGLTLRVASWPLGFLLIAKGNGKAFFWTELVTGSVHVGLIWFGIKYFGLTGTGIAFFVMYIFYCIVIYQIGKAYYKFTLSSNHNRFGAIIIIATGIVFLNPYLINETLALFINAGITIAIGLYSIKTIINITDSMDMMPNFMKKILNTSAFKTARPGKSQ